MVADWCMCVRVCVHVQSRFGCRSSHWHSTGCFGISSVSLHSQEHVRLIPDFACVKEHEWFVCFKPTQTHTNCIHATNWVHMCLYANIHTKCKLLSVFLVCSVVQHV